MAGFPPIPFDEARTVSGGEVESLSANKITVGQMKASGVRVGQKVDASELPKWRGIGVEWSAGTTVTALMHDVDADRTLFRVNHGGSQAISFDSDASPALSITGGIVTGTGSDISADFITAGTITAEEIILSNSASSILRSGNFSSGSAGWQILGDGTAEFNNVTVRGTVEASDIKLQGSGVFLSDDSGPRIEIEHSGGSGALPDINFYNGAGTLKGNIAISGTDNFSISALTAGGELHLFGPSGIAFEDPVITAIDAPGGSASAPSYTFSGDTDLGVYRDGSNSLGFAAGGSRVGRIAGSFFLPGSDNTLTLGNTNFRWTAVWAVDGTINTSDERVKTDTVVLDAGDLVDRIEPLRYRQSEVADGLWRFGFSAQQVADVLPPESFAAAIPPESEDGLWGLRPDQMVPVLWATVRDLRGRVLELEAN